ncbi:NAD-dependent epimerase/dehydratase family protein [Agrococcus baldri]|uniref:Nucleoside-diphosphate sugar epimerase n=1 Tax=Agrococcus baldri TaxID=153730 RepID=A0AA87RAR5_9MICO|nr:NAD(P)-dependent oxidoreductase [Agrococcus baldri]GEK79252.1 nucleoside-diphosphate sugar epimerase [Agrococcus baldri]
MRVLLAGATGAIGVPLTERLVAAGHEVVGLTRTAAGADRLRLLGAEPLTADAMQRDALLRATEGTRADAVVHMLTALRRSPVRHRDMHATNALRIDGSANLIEAARAVGASRFVTQSMMFGYGYGDHGTAVLTEETPYGVRGRDRAFERHLAAMRSAESQAFEAPGLDAVALRFGFFYGAGASRPLLPMLRRRQLPVVAGSGPLSWIHVDDAASATLAALERGGADRAYNVSDDQPVSWRTFMETLARELGAPRPPVVPAWLLRPLPYLHAMMTSSLRLSNERARQELGWVPEHPTYIEGTRALAAAA